VEVFGELLMIDGLWPPRSSDFNLCSCVWGTLKGRVRVNSPHALQELKDNIWREMADISRRALFCSETCVKAGQHFKTVMWYKLSWTAQEKLTLNLQWIQALYPFKLHLGTCSVECSVDSTWTVWVRTWRISG
jgi:hypothetical protein